ncbi:MAG: thiamine pyrophosphate-dependent enzyme [Nitrososphaerales archaeon]
MVTINELTDDEFLLKGNSSCAGCGATMAIRWVLKILGKNTVLVMPAGCVSVFQGMFPASAFGVPVIDSSFGAQSSISAGLAAAYKVKGKKINIVTLAGDGGTGDIGLHAVSAAAERGDDVLYICYDNEAYMNTGVQRSSLTPYGAKTGTNPEGKMEWKKNLPLIMAAHNITYVATASVGFPFDLMRKVKKAASLSGFRYIHILTPCPPGWGTAENLAAELGRLAVRCGIFPLFEVEKGKLTLHKVSSRLPVSKYFEVQRRFEGLTEEQLKYIQSRVDEELAYLEQLEKITSKVSKAE